MPDPGLFQLLSDVYEYRNADEGPVLQAGSIRPWNGVCFPGLPDDRWCDKVYPIHRCDTAACQLRRKFPAVFDDHFCNYPGIIYFKTG